MKVEVANLYRKVAERANAPVCMQINKFATSDNKHFTVIAELNKKAPLEEVASVFSEMLDRKARVVENSLRTIPHATANLVEFRAVANSYSVPFSDRFTVLSSTTASDDQDRIWRIEGEGEGRRLVLETEDDLSAILQAKKDRRQGMMVTASLDDLENFDVYSGDYVKYLDTASSTISYGIAFKTTEGLKVFDTSTHETASLRNEDILNALVPQKDLAKTVGLHEYEVANSIDNVRLEEIISYLRKIYPEEYVRLMDNTYRNIAG